MGHLPGLNVSDQAFPARTLKIAARPSIIRIVDNIGVAPLLCIAFEIPFLVQNGVRVARNVIVTGQALIERSSLSKKPHCIVAKWLLVVGEDRKAEKVATCGGRVS